MKNHTKEWNNLSEEFNTYKKTLFYGTADNIYTLWPIILGIIRKISKPSDPRALDYGCGTGMFCKKLESLGFKAVGIDISPKMISIGKKNLKNIELFAGDHKKAVEIAKHDGKFDVITAVTVLQFVPDIKSCIKSFSSSLNLGGHVIIVIHHPRKLEERKVDKIMSLGDTGKKVTIHRRTTEEYDNIFRQAGFKKTAEKSIKSSKRFLKEYKTKDSPDIPKYLLLAYRKIK